MFTSLFRASEDRSPGSDFWFGPVGNRAATGTIVTAETAMRLTAVYACVRVASESIAILPFRLYRKPSGSRRGREEVTDHWLYRLFARRPNRFHNPYLFRQLLQAHIELRGNAFCEIVDGPRGEIAELLPMHPDRVQIELMASGSWRYRHTLADGSQRVLRRDQVWHLRGLSDDGIIGLNPIEQNREAIAGGIEAQAFGNRLFANDAKPASGWIKFPGEFKDAEARRKYSSGLQEQMSGFRRGRLLVLDKGQEYNSVGVTAKDSQWLESRGASVTDIARMYRIPPHKIGDLSRSTNNNIEQQSLEFWTDSMLPRTEVWEASIEYDLLGDEAERAGLDVEFDFSRLLRGDSKSRGEYLRAMILTGVVTRNEGREWEGLNPIDGLDEPLIPANERLLSEDPADPAATDSTDPQSPDTPAQTDPADAGPADARRAAGAAAHAVSADASPDRLTALAQAAAERIARKEVHDVSRALRASAGADPQAAVVDLYARHADFVSQVLGVSAQAARDYCVAQADSLRPDFPPEAMVALSARRLTRLALTGCHHDDLTTEDTAP